MRERYRPYGYESNSQTLRWVTAGLVLWIVAALWLAWSDRQTQNVLLRLEDEHGISTLPPADPTNFEALQTYAAREGIDCPSTQAILDSTPGCERVISISRAYADQEIWSTLALVAVIVALFFTAFQWGTLVHRAGRNLPPLKSMGQRIKPDSLVLWSVIAGAMTFVFGLVGFLAIMGALISIVLIVWKVLPGFVELFKASDPAASTENDQAWRAEGAVPGLVYVWLGAAAIAFLANPNIVKRFWLPNFIGSEGNTITNAVTALRWLIVADLILIAPAILAVLTLRELHRRQEERHTRVGKVIYEPPMPKDPLEELLDSEVKKREERRRRRSGQ